MSIFWLVIYMGVIFGVRWFLSPYFEWRTHRNSTREFLWQDTKGNKRLTKLQEEELISKQPTRQLSLIVPAYNEEERIVEMLETHIDYLNAKKWDFEIIVVDDGSKDKTSEIALRIGALKKADLIALRSIVNCGKGAAVKSGMLVASGEYLLFADADGASDINCLDSLYRELKKPGYERGLVVGSRNHLVEGVVSERKWYRNILMHGLHFVVKVICGIPINDTQCGFKMFQREAAQAIFPTLHLERFAFDVELLYIAIQHRLPIAEVPINWQEIAGSKVDIIKDSLRMGRDLILVKLLYMFKLWNITDIKI